MRPRFSAASSNLVTRTTAALSRWTHRVGVTGARSRVRLDNAQRACPQLAQEYERWRAQALASFARETGRWRALSPPASNRTPHRRFRVPERRLVVEVDGGHHTEDDQIAHDARRDRWLEVEGYRVMRLPNIYVFQNLMNVVDSIWGALQELPDARASRRPHQERHRT